MTSIARLKIWRGDSADAGRWEHYQVPFEPGQSVLDALRWIRTTHDPSLAVRFSCINANACKECMIELDGTTVYACTARLAARRTVRAMMHPMLQRAVAPSPRRQVPISWRPQCMAAWAGAFTGTTEDRRADGKHLPA